MSAQGAHKITAEFEAELCRYTGSPFAVAVDSCCSALFLSLIYETIFLQLKIPIAIPKHTYPGVAMEILHAKLPVNFDHPANDNRFIQPGCLKGQYRLGYTMTYDSALRFTAGMWQPNSFQCLSFTGPYKHLKLGKGGAILTDNEHAYKWFKKARFSGRAECSYHEDDFDDNPVIGWNMYMMPEIAARGLALMPQFWNADGTAKHKADLCMKYPDLSKFKIFQ